MCVWLSSACLIMLDILTYNQKMKALFQLPHFIGQSPEALRGSHLPRSLRNSGTGLSCLEQSDFSRIRVSGGHLSSLEWVPGNVYRKTCGKQTLACGQGLWPRSLAVHIETGWASSQGKNTTYWKFREYGPIDEKSVQNGQPCGPG